MSTPFTRFRPLTAMAAVALLTIGLAGCVTITSPPAENDPAVSGPADPGGSPAPGCPVPATGPFGAGGPVTGAADLVGAPGLPPGSCAYAVENGSMLWIIAEPFDPGFPDTIVEWLSPYDWTSATAGTWSYGGHVSNTSLIPPAGLPERSARYANVHVFDAYPEEMTSNLFIDQDFLSEYGLEPGDEVAIFFAYF